MFDFSISDVGFVADFMETNEVYLRLEGITVAEINVKGIGER